MFFPQELEGICICISLFCVMALQALDVFLLHLVAEPELDVSSRAVHYGRTEILALNYVSVYWPPIAVATVALIYV